MFVFFFNDTATTEIYTLSLHDALPILGAGPSVSDACRRVIEAVGVGPAAGSCGAAVYANRQVITHDIEQDPLWAERSEEHTSELQSRQYLVCRLLLEKKKKNQGHYSHI